MGGRATCLPWLLFAVVALCSAGAFSTIVDYKAATLPSGRSVVGLPHVDLLVYYACARETWDEHSILCYASPYSSLQDSPRVYSHFGFLVMGIVWRGLGLTLFQADQLLRMVFGTLMLVLGAGVVRTALPMHERDKPIALAGYVLVICGGGVAWLAGLWQLVADWVMVWVVDGVRLESGAWFSTWPQAVESAEGGYGEWGASPVRVLFSVPECIYHVLFFGCMLSLLQGRKALGLLLLFLTWWSHPFTGALLGCIVCVYSVAQYTRRSGDLWFVAAAGTLQVVFMTYYLLYLPRFPEHLTVSKQMAGFSASMLLSKMLPAYGLLVLLPFANVKRWRRTSAKADSSDILMCTWLACELLLMFHDRITSTPMQPMHFTRGYLYLPLVYFSVRALHQLPGLAHARKYQLYCAGLLLLMQLPDTVLYLSRLPEQLRRGEMHFSVQHDILNTLQKLDGIKDTLTIHVLVSANMRSAEGLIPVLTHHRALKAHTFNVPFLPEKNLYTRALESALDDNLPGRFGLNALIVGAEQARQLSDQGLSIGAPMNLEGERYLVRVPSL
ncbi:MAG: hypothetical protein ACR2IE_15855 [Candidatus Sumerlaeaceae bacterium]